MEELFLLTIFMSKKLLKIFIFCLDPFPIFSKEFILLKVQIFFVWHLKGFSYGLMTMSLLISHLDEGLAGVNKGVKYHQKLTLDMFTILS